MWRATLSREAWMPIWGLSTESVSPGRLPILVVRNAAAGDGAGEYGCSRVSRLCVFLPLPVIQRADSAADSGIALADRSLPLLPKNPSGRLWLECRPELRNHGAPQARPREKARHECEREPQLIICLRLRRAHLSLHYIPSHRRVGTQTSGSC